MKISSQHLQALEDEICAVAQENAAKLTKNTVIPEKMQKFLDERFIQLIQKRAKTVSLFRQTVRDALKDWCDQKNGVIKRDEFETTNVIGDFMDKHLCVKIENLVTKEITDTRNKEAETKAEKKKTRPGQIMSAIRNFRDTLSQSLTEILKTDLSSVDKWPGQEWHKPHYETSEEKAAEIKSTFQEYSEPYTPGSDVRENQKRAAEIERALLRTPKHMKNSQEYMTNAKEWEREISNREKRAQNFRYIKFRSNQSDTEYIEVLQNSSKVTRVYAADGLPHGLLNEAIEITEGRAFVGSCPEGGRTPRCDFKDSNMKIRGHKVNQITIQGAGYSGENKNTKFFHPPRLDYFRTTQGHFIVAPSATNNEYPFGGFVTVHFDLKSYGGSSLQEALNKAQAQELLLEKLAAAGHTVEDIIPITIGILKLQKPDKFGETQGVLVNCDKGEHRLRPFWNNLSGLIHFKDNTEKRNRCFLAENDDSFFPLSLDTIDKAKTHLQSVYLTAGDNIRKIHEIGCSGLDLQPGNIGGGRFDNSGNYEGNGIIYDLGGIKSSDDPERDQTHFLHMLTDAATFIRGIFWEYRDRILKQDTNAKDLEKHVFNPSDIDLYRDALAAYMRKDASAEEIGEISGYCLKLSQKYLSEDRKIMARKTLPQNTAGSERRKILAIRLAQKTIPDTQKDLKASVQTMLTPELSAIEFLAEMLDKLYPLVRRIAEKQNISSIPSDDDMERIVALYLAYPYHYQRVSKNLQDLQFNQGIRFRH